MNPVAEVQARIAVIETRFGATAETRPEPAPATARASFEQVLATALSSSATRGTAAPGSWFGPLAWPMAPGAAGASTGVPPEAARARWRPAIESAALQAGVPVELLEALVWTESGFRPDAVSSAGAIGLTQLMPGTAAGLGVDPHDPTQNLVGGARYLRQQLDRFGDVGLALAAYNAGPGRVEQYGGIPPIPETVRYVATVTARFQQLSEAAP